MDKRPPSLVTEDTTGDGFAIFNTADLVVPILISVPHAGRDYPDILRDNLRIRSTDLLRLEDRYADRLVAPAIAAGFPAIIAHRARAWIDLNRSEEELDPEMIEGAIGTVKSVGSAKMRGGLGLIPRRLLHHGDIWRRPFAAAEVETRIMSYHRPYHAALERTLARIRSKFGVALLVDIHSMPPLPLTSGPGARIVVGDRFGQSAASIYSEIILGRLKQNGIPAALNHPYSGDYTLRRHGKVRNNIHAVQIEVDRSLYLDSDLHEPVEAMGPVAALISELLWLLGDQTGSAAIPMAAE